MERFLLANLITLVVLAMVFKVIFPTLMTISPEVKLLLSMDLDYHFTQELFFILALVAASYYILKFAYKKEQIIYCKPLP